MQQSIASAAAAKRSLACSLVFIRAAAAPLYA